MQNSLKQDRTQVIMHYGFGPDTKLRKMLFSNIRAMTHIVSFQSTITVLKGKKISLKAKESN